MRTIVVSTMLLMCGSTSGQDSLLAYQRSLRPAEPVLTPQTERLQVVKSLAVQLATEPQIFPTDQQFYAVMFTAPWCGPCQAYKTSGQFDRLKSRFRVTVVDVDQDKRWNVHSVPTFWLCDRATRTRVKAWTGRTDVETIEREVSRIREARTKIKIIRLNE